MEMAAPDVSRVIVSRVFSPTKQSPGWLGDCFPSLAVTMVGQFLRSSEQLPGVDQSRYFEYSLPVNKTVESRYNCDPISVVH